MNLSKLGTSLIEVMISLLLLSIFLFGLDATQITALSHTKAAYFFSVAVQQVKQMGERLIACKKNHCDQQITLWNQQNAEVLPQGRGKVSGSYPDYLITLFWGNKKREVCQQNKIGKEGCLQLKIHAYS